MRFMFSLCLLGCLGLPASATSATLTATVTRVIDGDTLDAELRVLDVEGNPVPLEIRVRLIGIDTPETNIRDRKRAAERCALEAKQFVAKLVPPGTVIRLVADPGRKRGNYNRHLFYVETQEGKDVGLALLKAGLAEEVNFEKDSYQRRAVYQDAAKHADKPVCK